MRKITSIVLSLIMVASLFSSVSVFADETVYTLGDSELTVQFEDHAVIAGHARDNDNGAKTVSYMGTSVTNKPTNDITVNVTKAGYYDVELVMGHGASAWGQTKVSLLDSSQNVIASFSNNIRPDEVLTGYTYSDTTGDGAGHTLSPMCKYTNAHSGIRYIWLNAGTITITTSHGSGNTTSLDYIKLMPATFDVLSASDAVKRIEFEDIVADKKTAHATASGDALVYTAWTSGPGSITYRFVAEQDGNYDIEYVIGCTTAADSWSPWTVTLDGEAFSDYHSDKVGWAVDELGYTEKESACQLMLYRKSNVPLAKGEHYITFNFTLLGDANSGTRYTYILDYIEFKKNNSSTPADTFTVDGNNITAVVNYKNAYAGTVILALYNGEDRLVSAIPQIIAEPTNQITVKATESKAFDTAKIFIWNSEEGMVPLDLPKTFENK